MTQTRTETRGALRGFSDRLGRRFGWLDSGALRVAAQDHTGLQDFGSPELEPTLSTLLESLENEADLHPLGRFLMRGHLTQLLANRLRLTENWKSKTAALDASKVQRPVFVVGMPRTGSTFLHELLAEDPHNRAPRVWEVMFPIPREGNEEEDRAKRIRKTEACLWFFRRLAPNADAVYPVRARKPQECVAIQSHTMLSEEFIITCDIPGYRKFLRAADLTPAYAWEKRFLQYLQLDGPARRWVLKSPDHVFGLEELFSVFPDAVIIQTHRDPVEVLRSTIELTRVLHDLYAWKRDRDGAAEREAGALAEATDCFIHFRDRHPELDERFIDVKYTEMAANPMAAVRRIYAQLGWQMTAEAERRIQAMAASRSRYRGRKPTPNPEELRRGASAEAIRFARYCSRFGLSCEGGA